MAYITKVASGYRAQVQRAGHRVSQTFRTKRAAQEWAAREEAALLDTKRGRWPQRTLREAFDRYAREVSPTKRGARDEIICLRAIAEQLGPVADKQFAAVTAADLAPWRDRRLREVSSSTVRRNFTLLSHVWTIGKREWLWCGDSPIRALSWPEEGAPRERRVLPSEVKRICRALHYVTGDVRTKGQEIALVFLVALRTGMRLGEILSLTDAAVDLQRRVVRVQHKMQYLTGRPRDVPITKAGARLLGQVAGRGQLFTLTPRALGLAFRETCKRLLIRDLHFHDTRAEALTRLSRRVDVMTLAKISGHADLRTLQAHYYRETAADIAQRI